MAAAIAVLLWSRSEKVKLRYTVFVSDGDSAVYKAVCSVKNSEGTYGKDHPILQEECLNHVSKRLSTRLR